MKALLLFLYFVARIHSYTIHVSNTNTFKTSRRRYEEEILTRTTTSSLFASSTRSFDFDYEAVYQDVLPNSKYRNNNNLQNDIDYGDERELIVNNDIAYISGTQTPDISQKDAIISTDPSVLVVAGPGAGKTRVLSARLAYLLDSAMCKPSEVLVISFTGGAADRIKMRAGDILRAEKSVATTSGVNSDTFHGFGSSVVKKYYNLIFNSSPQGAPNNIIIADDNDQKAIMLALLEAKGYPPNEASATNILRKIRFWKELGLGYLGVRRQSGWTWTEQRAYELYPEYQTKLRSLSAVDFGDLQLHTLRLFRDYPYILESYRAMYKHILVDEFQDVSPAQYDILRMLVLGHNRSAMKNSANKASSSSSSSSGSLSFGDVGTGIVGGSSGLADFSSGDADLPISIDMNHKIASSQAILRVVGDVSSARSLSSSSSDGFDGVDDESNTDSNGSIDIDRARPIDQKRVVNVFAAGDDDQSIYGWRGAQVELMRRFRFDFPGAKTLKFHVTYRMPDAICKISNTLISPISGRIHKSLRSSALSNVFASNNKLLMESDNSLSKDGGDFDFKDGGSRTPIEVRSMGSEADEMAWICSYLRSRVAAGGPQTSCKQDYNIAVLTRTNTDFRRVLHELEAHGVPYRERGYGPWQAPSGAGSPLSFLRLLHQPDDNVAFQVAIDNDLILSTLEKDEVKKVIMPRLKQISSTKGMSLFEASRDAILTGQFAGKYALGLSRFILKYDALAANLQMYFRRGESGQRTIYNILQAAYQLRWSPELATSINELSRSVASHDSLSQFFDTIRSERDIIVDGTSNSGLISIPGGLSGTSGTRKPVNVWVMVMHAAKGLEFDEVLLPFWTLGNVPKRDNAEERRLAFVSLTRARERVMISYSKTRAVVGAVPALETYPSPFISEMRDSGVSSMRFEDLSSPSGRDVYAKKTVVNSGSIGSKGKASSKEALDGSDRRPHPFLSQDLKSYIDQKIDQKAQSRARKGSIADDAPSAPLLVEPSSARNQHSGLTAADIDRLLHDKKRTQSELKELFKSAIRTDFGIVRGSCEVAGQKKHLSKCSAAELAAYLLTLLQLKSK